MDKEARKEAIKEKLFLSKKPISATALAKTLGVSRQIIVGDISLLRAEGFDVIATNKGYVLSDSGRRGEFRAVICSKHVTDDIFDEICTIVDLGGRMIDIYVEHPVYKKVIIPMNIKSRSEAKTYVERFMEKNVKHLSELSRNGEHYHTIEADNELMLLRIQKALNDKGYLVK